jgi:hypothetical protein
MTRRYTSGFDILGFDTDPTPGDPDLIMSQVVPTYQSIGDDAEAAVNALNSNAIESGTGDAMQALQNLIGTSFPPKLQLAADSYHSAASIYTAYAQGLREAQNQLDRAMDQAVPVAALANSTVPPAPPNATADQVAALQQQQQSVNQASDQLTAAKQLAQDAAEIRNDAGNTFNTDLNDVSAIPDLSWWQKFLDWFENSPIFQIFVDIAIAIVSIFVPVVGLALGAIVFAAFTAINTIATGHFDVGAFVTGLFTLALGAGAVTGVFKAASTAIWSTVKATAAGDSIFSSAAGTAIKGIEGATGAIGNLNPVVKSGLGVVSDFGVDSANQAVSGAIDGKEFDPAKVFGSAAVVAVVGGAFDGAKDHFGFGDEESPGGEAPESVLPGPGDTPPPVPPKGPRPMPEPSDTIDATTTPPATTTPTATTQAGSSGSGPSVVASPHEAAGNAFTEGGALIGGLAGTGTAAGIATAQGADPSDVQADAAGDAGDLVPDLVHAPLPEN